MNGFRWVLLVCEHLRKTFLIIGLVALAVFIVVWLVARRPHRG